MTCFEVFIFIHCFPLLWCVLWLNGIVRDSTPPLANSPSLGRKRGNPVLRRGANLVLYINLLMQRESVRHDRKISPHFFRIFSHADCYYTFMCTLLGRRGEEVENKRHQTILGQSKSTYESRSSSLQSFRIAAESRISRDSTSSTAFPELNLGALKTRGPTFFFNFLFCFSFRLLKEFTYKANNQPGSFWNSACIRTVKE